MRQNKTKIKICGLRREEDIAYVNEAGADFAGFIINVPKSRRNVSPDRVRQLVRGLSPEICAVGVFVREPMDGILSMAEDGTLGAVQLHGKESESYVEELKEKLDACYEKTGRKVLLIQAFSIEEKQDLVRAMQSRADLVLLDHGAGGTGEVFDWSMIENWNRPYLLAGGLGTENLGQALSKLHPYAIDISSGVETEGYKDPDKIRKIVQIVEEYENPYQNHDNGEKQKEDIMSKGRFGVHGGQYMPETLMNAVIELEEAYEYYKKDPEFNAELTRLYDEYAGRPSRLTYAARMTEDLGGAKIYLKREDLNHTGSHKINNVLGQVLLAKKMGKTRVIAETGAGQHGVATATVAALMGMECEVYMGEEDTIRQALNVYRMRLLGAKVHPVKTGTATLKDAVSEAMREWTSRIDDTHYVLGSVMGPHPFPTIVRDFQAVISKEIKEQMLEKEGRLPDVVMACVGGGSNAMGAFYHFIEDEQVQLIGCEAAGRGVNTKDTAATIATGRLGIFHGMKSYFCQDEYGQIAPVYSISAGLDYPGIGPEHAHLYDIGRAQYVPVTDDEAVDAFEYLSRMEGIIPAIESAHAVAYAKKIAPTMEKDKIIVINISGRGDKDCAAIARYRGEEIYE